MTTSTRFWRDGVLPRVVFVPFAFAWLLLRPMELLRQIFSRQERTSSRLCIEAGVMGWKSIEFKELYQCACEYLSAEQVVQLAVDKETSYLRQVRAALDEKRPTHYVYDPRTGDPRWHVGLWQSLRIALMCEARGIVPIALLADFSHRVFRMQAAIATAHRGVVISFLSSRRGGPIFPHRRILAPSLMPLSQATLNMLDEMRAVRPPQQPTKAMFLGSLYEPRTTILREISERLEARGLTLEIKGRVAGGPRIPDSEYWGGLAHSGIIVTTSDQIDLAINDWKWIHHMTYRYLEAIVSGSLLIAPEVPGVRRYFEPGRHFAPFTSPAQAADVIEYYLRNDTERRELAERGRKRAYELVSARSFWMCIDAALGADSLQ